MINDGNENDNDVDNDNDNDDQEIKRILKQAQEEIYRALVVEQECEQVLLKLRSEIAHLAICINRQKQREIEVKKSNLDDLGEVFIAMDGLIEDLNDLQDQIHTMSLCGLD